LDSLKIPALGNKSQEDPQAPPLKITSPKFNPHRVRGGRRGVLSCMELGRVRNQRKGGFGVLFRL